MKHSPPNWPPPSHDYLADLQQYVTEGGRRLHLREMTISRTYAGLTEGRPRKARQHNEKFIARLQIKAAESDEAVQVICEELSEEDPEHPLLPPVATTLRIISDEHVHDVDAQYAWVTVLWLQCDRDIRPSAALAAVAERIDWKKYGRDGRV